jgi:carbamoyltransferase
MDILGLHYGHDLGACLLRDGRIVVVIEEERLTRVKQALPQGTRALWAQFNQKFGYFPWASMNYCLRAGDIGIDDLDAIVLSDFFPHGAAELIPVKDQRKVMVANQPHGGSHHYLHALSAFHSSEFEHAAVLIVDGDGTTNQDGYEAETGYLFSRNDGGKEIFKNRYMEVNGIWSGLGWMYDTVSAVLGFVNTRLGYLGEPGKTMGLAPYGVPDEALARPWLALDGYKIDFSGFKDFMKVSGLSDRVSFSSRAQALIQNEKDIEQFAMNLAYKAQAELERAIGHLAHRLHQDTQAKYLCLSGGVALNAVVNGLLRATGIFEDIFVMPAAGDNGQAIGAAYYGHLALGGARVAPLLHAFGGRAYGEDCVQAALLRAGLAYTALENEELSAKDAALRLSQGNVVGWFQGGSEFGPRSLGHRSILADPRAHGIRDHINERVKFREPFRPFAPSVLMERANEIFDLRGESPYMLFVAPVREEWKARIPAVVHVDGTARLQTVNPSIDMVYHALISEFARLTDVPVVLNTSFNLRGMPIVETPEDAIAAFLVTELEAIYLGRFRAEQPEPCHMFLSFVPGTVRDLVFEYPEQRKGVKGVTLQAREGSHFQIGDAPMLLVLECALNAAPLEQALERIWGQVRNAAAESAIKLLRARIQELLRAGVLKLRIDASDAGIQRRIHI